MVCNKIIHISILTACVAILSSSMCNRMVEVKKVAVKRFKSKISQEEREDLSAIPEIVLMRHQAIEDSGLEVDEY